MAITQKFDWTKLKFANHRLASDVNPYEVVSVVSHKTIIIREMNAEALKWTKDIVQGGFSHTVTNQEKQKWKITSNKKAPLFKIRLNKSGMTYCRVTKQFVDKFVWKDRYGDKYYLSDTPIKYYDYNF